MRKIIFSLSLMSLVGVASVSCSRDFTETQFFQDEKAGAITTVEQLQSFVNGTFTKMRSANYLGREYRALAQVHTDETYCTQRTGRNVQFATYRLTSQTAAVANTWYAIYQVIANANTVINAPDNLTWGEASDPSLVATRVKYLKGQAYAARALAFFDLLRLYGQQYSGGRLGVVLPTEYNPSVLMGRATVAETQAKIEADFAAALANVGDSGEVSAKNYLNKYSIEALMSRYYLYKGEYDKVIAYANDVISSGNYSVVASNDYIKSFSQEGGVNSVFELSLGINGSLGYNAYDLIVNSNGYANIAVLPEVYSSYAAGDVRKSAINANRLGEYFVNGKFSNFVGSSNIKVVRYEEVLLNAAEAEIVAGSSANALTYYNAIRTKRGLPAATSVTFEDIKKERRLELLGEGFRYWDLLRWNEVVPYYTSAGVRDTSKDKRVGDNLLAYPIPLSETNVPGTPVVSNPGYDN
ncbi:RagB/SusD family nutrient uptake outer membrane protein [Bergeyella sp. RCAD1439]|uniref:RagB/SusD family nutrient uptake outer membrane protein n=1 Tax=Bergeyella anatis TaxID=3113737 RepID=UPI002E18CCD8|nr:RagB/SusD family nutrient uptake outer membrane protein [Bergeyella sp. RCAD1439]